MSKRSDRFTEEEVKLGTENILYCKNKLRIQVYIFTEEGVAYYSTWTIELYCENQVTDIYTIQYSFTQEKD